LAISGETARRWIRGNSLPDETRLTVLVEWLGLDLQQVFSHAPEPAAGLGADLQTSELLKLFMQMETPKKQLVLDFLRSLT
jgi:hypothetical protein